MVVADTMIVEPEEEANARFDILDMRDGCHREELFVNGRRQLRLSKCRGHILQELAKIPVRDIALAGEGGDDRIGEHGAGEEVRVLADDCWLR